MAAKDGSPLALLMANRLAAPVVLLMLTAGVFWKLTLTDQYTWMTAPGFVHKVRPWYEMQARAWQAGRMPLWDPYQQGGQPLVGQGSPGAAYPLNWILFQLPLENGRMRDGFLDGYFVLIHYVAALCAYLLCRELGRSRTASVIAGAAFGLGGCIGATGDPRMLNAAVWSPAILLFFVRSARVRHPARSAGLAGVCLGMSWLSGDIQIPLFLSITFAVLWIWLIFRNGRRALAHAALFSSFAFASGALQILPSIEYGARVVNSSGQRPYAAQLDQSVPPSSLPGLVLPGFRDSYAIYIGFTAVSLAILALFAASKELGVRVGAAIAAGGLALMLGGYSFLHGILYAVLPVFETASAPHTAAIIFHLGVITLFVYGIDCLADGRLDGRLLRHAVFAVALAGGLVLTVALFMTALGNTLRDERGVAAGTAAVALAAVLALRQRGLLAPRPTRCAVGALLLWEAGLVAGFEFQRVAGQKLSSTQYSDTAHFIEYLRYQPKPLRVEIDSQAVPYNLGDLYGIDTFEGRDPAGALRFAANYYIGHKPARSDQIEIFREGNLALYSNPAAHPRVSVARDRPCPVRDEVELVGRTQNNLEILAGLGCPGTVVAAETYSAGWRATVDRVRVPVREMPGALRGVDAGSGEHRIRMQYAPASIYWGAALTGAAWLGCAVLCATPLLRRGRGHT